VHVHISMCFFMYMYLYLNFIMYVYMWMYLLMFLSMATSNLNCFSIYWSWISWLCLKQNEKKAFTLQLSLHLLQQIAKNSIACPMQEKSPCLAFFVLRLVPRPRTLLIRPLSKSLQSTLLWWTREKVRARTPTSLEKTNAEPCCRKRAMRFHSLSNMAFGLWGLHA